MASVQTIQKQKASDDDDFFSAFGGDIREIERVTKVYPMKITPYYQSLIESYQDPIWRQAVPCAEELHDSFNVEDPLEEERHTPVPYLVHKYPDRVLLLASSTCAMYCRFCTRKRKVGRIRQIPLEEIFNAIDYIALHPEIRDVIVSGGDPLMRSDSDIEEILKRLREISHVQIIRIGTRMPCVNPKRITPDLASIIARYHPVFVNIHFNHPKELTLEVKQACSLLANAGVPLGSQTVLLRGVNDDVETMRELMTGLLMMRVRPYYIYQCDLVRGVEHFRTPVEKGIEIMKHLQGFTSGLALPHYVIDGPGGKVPISPQYVKQITSDQIIVTNFLDQLYAYPGIQRSTQKRFANTSIKRIGIAYNLKRVPLDGERLDRYAEFDDLETIDAIRKVFEDHDYEVLLLEADQQFFEKVKESGVDFVFNIAEGICGESRESHIPAILEMLNIPYSGSGVLSQAITLNKSRKKEILNYHGIATPRYQLFRKPSQRVDKDLKYPLIVKPDAEGSSVGISNESLVFDEQQLRVQIARVVKQYEQYALVEEYLPGREFTVGLIGNQRPMVLPIVEVTFDNLPEGIHHFDSYEAKWTYDSPDAVADPLVCPATISPALKKKIERIAKRTYSTLECHDFCRIDLRLDAKGNPSIIDVNALPGLMPDIRHNSRFIRSAYACNMSYDEVIMAVFRAALKRYNLSLSVKK